MKLLIDTDTGSDDAVALIMALRYPDAEVVALTTVSGNVDVDQGTANARYALELCDADVPTYRGAERPLLREPRYAHGFHGRDGLGDQGFVPERPQADEGHAVPALIDLLAAGDTTLVTLGPLTNVALALQQAPELAGTVPRCVVMGGAACTVGNVTPAAEFNIWSDPEAAALVFASGMPIEMVGWELCRADAALTPDEMDEIRALDTPYAHFTIDCNATAIEASQRRGQPGLMLPDPVAMAVVLDPSIATRTGRHNVAIETHGRLTRGMTVVDALDVTGREPRSTVVWEVDVPRWKELLRKSVQ